MISMDLSEKRIFRFCERTTPCFIWRKRIEREKKKERKRSFVYTLFEKTIDNSFTLRYFKRTALDEKDESTFH